MRYLIFLLIFLPSQLRAQNNKYAQVDRFAASVGYHSADSLSRILTEPYHTELEKVRSIFYWITQHISYDVEKYNKSAWLQMTDYWQFSHEDSIQKWNERINKILTKKKGVCQDYSELFKTLCDNANIQAEIVVGYVRLRPDEIGHRLQSEHAWNAVKIGGAWYLLDATWASGSVDDGVTHFNKKFNSSYFLPDPDVMKWDHFPQDSRWWLTNDSLPINDCGKLPFFYPPQNGKIKNFKPLNGILNVKKGDRIRFDFEVKGTKPEYDIVIIPDQIYDNSSDTLPVTPMTTHKGKVNATGYKGMTDDELNTVFESADSVAGDVIRVPESKDYIVNKNMITCYYTIQSDKINGLDIYYGDELVLQYKVNIIK